MTRKRMTRVLVRALCPGHYGLSPSRARALPGSGTVNEAQLHNTYIRRFSDYNPVNNEVAPGQFFRFFREPVLRILL
jgi:hypothetical protein